MTESRQHSTQTNQNKVTNSSIKDTTIQNSPETAAPSVALTAAKPQGFLRSLFDDLSIAQVIAGALAAATVFLLSSVIGVAGSLIGAAIGSVISAVSSQIYKKALSASADKLRDVGPTSLMDSVDASSIKKEEEMSTSSEDETTFIPTRTNTTEKSAAAHVMSANDLRYTAPNANGEDPALRRAHERRNRKAKVQRQVLVVSVVSSLIAIVICAGIITFATQGEGIGTKTEPILPAITNYDHSSSNVASEPYDNNNESNTSEGESSSASDNASSNSSGSSNGTSESPDSNNSGNANSNETGGSAAQNPSGNTDTNTGDSNNSNGSAGSSGSNDSSSSGGSDNTGDSDGSGTSSGSGSAGDSSSA